MFKKIFSMKGLICLFAIIALCIGALFVSDLGAIVYEKFFKGNILVGGKAQVVGCGVETMRIGYVSATTISIDDPGKTLACVGLTAGVAEIGTTEGYTVVNDAADFLRFTVQLPDTWLDNGIATNMEFEFDILEILAGCTIDVRFFEYGNTTAILTDTIVIADAATRGWVNLITNSTGIGADADLGPGDVLLLELTANADTDDFNIYGVRMKYAIGLERTIAESAR